MFCCSKKQFLALRTVVMKHNVGERSQMQKSTDSVRFHLCEVQNEAGLTVDERNQKNGYFLVLFIEPDFI